MNRLSQEKSPYLKQHATNPVDWYPWGEEAFAKARAEDKPIFLSVGYSTCHWCHVMERESFEDHAVALALSHGFVSVKVDREERPDVDAIYMDAIQAISGHGGWPMSVFLTPELKPFFGGTYFPKDRFLYVLEQISLAWKSDRVRAMESSKKLMEWMLENAPQASGIRNVASLLGRFEERWKSDFDPAHGGKIGAPKFPPASELRLAMRIHSKNKNPFALESVERTLLSMARGGITDQLGGGIHRYATDDAWLIPHFEKMLYDQAAMSEAYREAYLITGKKEYRLTLKEILDYVKREMSCPGGGFFSAEDADSEGVEGKFYVWEWKELKDSLPNDEWKAIQNYFKLSEGGNFEHNWNILELASHASRIDRSPELCSGLRRLKAIRDRRVRPLRDEKIISSWNGLMASAFASADALFPGDDYYETAALAVSAVLKARSADGGLARRSMNNEVKGEGFLDDYAFVVSACLDLYLSRFDERWLSEAVGLQNLQDGRFWDYEAGGYFFSVADDPSLIIRRKDYFDNVIPSGNSVSLANLYRLYVITGDSKWKARADSLIASLPEEVERYPWGFPRLLMALSDWDKGGRQLVLVTDDGGSEVQAVLSKIRNKFYPDLLLIQGGTSTQTGIASGKSTHGKKWAGYLCDERGCQPPVYDEESLAALLF